MTTTPEALRLAREALAELLKRDQINTCQHQSTHRGGGIWTICDDCGMKWADDRGGMPEWQDPPEWRQATAAIAAIDALTAPSGEPTAMSRIEAAGRKAMARMYGATAQAAPAPLPGGGAHNDSLSRQGGADET